MHSNYNISAGYEVEPLFWGLGLEGDFSEVLYIDRDLCSFIFGHFDGRDANLWFCDGEIFPVQAYASNTIITGLLAKEGVPPSLDPPPDPGYASEIKVSPEKAETTPNSVKMSPSLIAKIKELAALEGTNCSQFIISSIEHYLQNLDTLIPIELKDDTALDTFTRIASQLNTLTKELNIFNKHTGNLTASELEEKCTHIRDITIEGLEFISSENKKLFADKERKFYEN